MRQKHDAGRDLHVMAELKILSKIESLGHADVPIVLEHHHGEGASRNHVTNNKLCQHVEAELDIGNGLDKTNRDQPNDGKKHANHKCPRRKASIPTSNDTKGDANHDQKEGYNELATKKKKNKRVGAKSETYRHTTNLQHRGTSS